MIDIDAGLVRGLVAGQFPEWSDLPVEPVPRQGWDNRTFRLGRELSVRLPSHEVYVAAVEKEDRCLPALAGRLPVPVPVPVATGRPADAYPFPWSVRRWLAGETLDTAAHVDRAGLARDLGGFLTALRAAPTREGRACGRHSFFRGCHPSVYSDQVQQALEELEGVVDTAACAAVWADALTTAWTRPPAWFHGDIAAGNLLVADGALSAVIDFGTCGVGDPACDLVIAWTYFRGDERKLFRESAGLPDDAWRRARGWALWKALATMSGLSSPDPGGFQARVLPHVLDDPVIA
ncbi:aminoglycoside phosphotransferase [Sphaerisporangium krabiense]|uniref:Aminoglycoside phosphotransferase (APT) family kinase protein n=1 Tax=Sphaerisporangium krabiense TaxID=763782 RepID=A0A7W8Z0H3_9ACTN|nr:aminoglycoside phosphotransferase family protein [Sphaerisporangium krabiense]MBB5625203.1 aminoglycoside phosphotransferase (APT) family kinase protein [Sphaerisporangium krabiense]GII64288.1 aminoglycoside phosphotransferase [Sphaerisporangium krabiense]